MSNRVATTTGVFLHTITKTTTAALPTISVATAVNVCFLFLLVRSQKTKTVRTQSTVADDADDAAEDDSRSWKSAEISKLTFLHFSFCTAKLLLLRTSIVMLFDFRGCFLPPCDFQNSAHSFGSLSLSSSVEIGLFSAFSALCARFCLLSSGSTNTCKH